jgi:anti-sigma B factor antagonist
VLKIHQDKWVDGCALVRPEGDLDVFTVAPFRRALAELAGSGRLIIDLSAVVFIDSAGLGALIGGIRGTREQGGQVVVACSRPGLVRVLRSTGLDKMVTVTASVAEAARALRPPAGAEPVDNDDSIREPAAPQRDVELPGR